MRILFLGETWRGSFARSMREAIEASPDVDVDEIGVDHFLPSAASLAGRGVKRLLWPLYRREFTRAIHAALAERRPHVLVAYKGTGVSADVIRRARAHGVFTVNIFPDYSPHAYGAPLKEAVGAYDLVVSTKPFHPPAWRTVYGYGNPCVFVPHGYDPKIHLWSTPPSETDLDVVLAATWRGEYQALMEDLSGWLTGLRVGIVGNGWERCRSRLPASWVVAPGLHGRAYGEWLRRGHIALAPVQQDVLIAGRRQPGDQDTTRTYELAAMGCFFLHRRTPYAQQVYDADTEVPMWDDAAELGALVRRYLPEPVERRQMAARAHARAVPAYSILNRAAHILEEVRRHMAGRAGAP